MAPARRFHILDYGSHTTQLIARRQPRVQPSTARSTPQAHLADQIRAKSEPRAIILKRRTRNVLRQQFTKRRSGAVRARPAVLSSCYGEQLIAHQLGVPRRTEPKREYGPRRVSGRTVGCVTPHPFAKGEELSGVDEPRRPPHRHTACFHTTHRPSHARSAANREPEEEDFAIRFTPSLVHTPRGHRAPEGVPVRRLAAGAELDSGSLVVEAVDAISAKVGPTDSRDLWAQRRRRFSVAGRAVPTARSETVLSASRGQRALREGEFRERWSARCDRAVH